MEFLTACQSSPNLLQALLSSINETTIVTDIDGVILNANPAVEKLTGYRAEGLKGKRLSLLFTPEDLYPLYPNLLQMARNNLSFKGEMLLIRKNDVRFFANVTLQPFFESGCGEHRILFCIQDIHKEKRLENAMNVSCFEDLVRIANGVAHELRNPLVGIGGFVARLLDVCRAADEQHTYYRHIISNLKKIEKLVAKIEFLSKLPMPVLRRHSVHNVIDESLRPYLNEIEKRGIELKMDVAALSLPLDVDLVARVFSILIENALDALKQGQCLMIHGELEDNHYAVAVTDTGLGISSEDLPYVFDPFYSTKADGVGMDLAIAKRIMSSHGGSIDVDSRKGKGTTFTLRFPMERRRAIRVSRLPESALVHQPRGR